MKKVFKLLFLLAIASFSLMLISCEQKNKSQLDQLLVMKDGLLFKDSTSTTPYTGRHKSKVLYKIIEYEVKDGIKNGEFMLYFPNGKIEMKGYIVDDKN